MQDLINRLNEATKAYDAGSPIMSDAEWDRIKQQEEEAKLAEIKLFPSPGIELVIRITFFSLPTNVNSRFVLKVLIASLT